MSESAAKRTEKTADTIINERLAQAGEQAFAILRDRISELEGVIGDRNVTYLIQGVKSRYGVDLEQKGEIQTDGAKLREALAEDKYEYYYIDPVQRLGERIQYTLSSFLSEGMGCQGSNLSDLGALLDWKGSVCTEIVGVLETFATHIGDRSGKVRCE